MLSEAFVFPVTISLVGGAGGTINWPGLRLYLIVPLAKWWGQVIQTSVQSNSIRNSTHSQKAVAVPIGSCAAGLPGVIPQCKRQSRDLIKILKTT